VTQPGAAGTIPIGLARRQNAFRRTRHGSFSDGYRTHHSEKLPTMRRDRLTVCPQRILTFSSTLGQPVALRLCLRSVNRQQMQRLARGQPRDDDARFCTLRGTLPVGTQAAPARGFGESDPCGPPDSSTPQRPPDVPLEAAGGTSIDGHEPALCVLPVSQWLIQCACHPNGVKMRVVVMKLPPEVLQFFKEQGAKGGRIGGRRALETMTPAQRVARAKKASAAAARKRSAAKKPK
jgi:hypothetical protein